MFTSKLRTSEFIINDSTKVDVFDDSTKGRGLHLAMRSTPYGQMYGTTAFPKELEIPESDWEGIIKQQEQEGSRISDQCINANLNCKDQEQTNYCWGNAPVHCVEIIRVQANQPLVYLSAASVCAPVANYRNVGGYGGTALQRIIDFGPIPETKWPKNYWQSNKYATPDNLKLGQNYRVTEWWELVPRNLKQLVSCAIRRIPIAVGYNWWGHEVTICDAVWLDGTVAIRARNSWGMGYGQKGFFIIQGNRMLPDDAVCARVAMAA